MGEETFRESARKRPAMYIGNDGVEDLFGRMIMGCIEICNTQEIAFEIILHHDADCTMRLGSQHDLTALLPSFDNYSLLGNTYFPAFLKAVSDKFEVIFKTHTEMEINFSLDEAVRWDINVRYFKLSEKMLQVALLNRRTEIITIDHRQKSLNQNYYHFPQGIFYLFDRIKAEVLGTPELFITFDGKVNTNHYQIGLAYRTDWHPNPYIESYANDVHTSCGGSLVNGILEGLIKACEAYVQENKLTKLKIKQKKFANGLIIVCAVRGAPFRYMGSFRDTLRDDVVQAEARAITLQMTLDFLNNQKEKADQFLLRFDTTKFASGLY